MRNFWRNVGWFFQDVFGWVVDRPYFIRHWWQHRRDCKHLRRRIIDVVVYDVVWPNEGEPDIQHKFKCLDCPREWWE